MNMIAMDNQPFSVTSDQGFIDLLATLEPSYLIPSNKYFTDTMLPQTYESLKIKVNTELSEASFLSFTTDIWTNSKTKTSYLSLTAHWLNESFEYKHRALHCKEIKGSHTGFNICENIKEMLENWGINMNRIHVFLRDNAFNMKAGMLMLESSSAPCFIHTLQLIIKDSLFTESNISVLIAKARQTVGHFNHSSTACEKLKKSR